MPKRDPCSELAKTVTEWAMAIGERPDVKNIDDVVAVMQKEVPEFTRAEVVASINEATTGHREAATDLQKKLQGLRREARNDNELHRKITAVERHLKEGTLPETQRRAPKPGDPLDPLRESLAEVDRMGDEASAKWQAEVARLRAELEGATAASGVLREVAKRMARLSPLDADGNCFACGMDESDDSHAFDCPWAIAKALYGEPPVNWSGEWHDAMRALAAKGGA